MTKKPITFTLLALGFTAMIGQFVLIRELLVVFYGNELAVGVMLASWLFWVGTGSLSMGRFSRRISSPVPFYACGYLLSVLFMAGEVCLLRLAHPLLGLGVGEIVGFPVIFLTVFSVLAPLSLVIGAQFALGVRIYASTASDIGRAYVLESLGSITGGLVFSFILVRWLEPLQIVFLAGTTGLLPVGWLVLAGRSGPVRKVFVALTGLVWLALLLLSYYGGHLAEKTTVKMAWKGRKVVYAGNSIYGNIVITRLKDEYSLFENGLLMFTSPEALAREEAVHYALLSHPEPSKVLLIGGGIGGSLREVLKHPVKQVDYVELDPMVVTASRDFIARQEAKALEDGRVKIHHLDGRLFVVSTEEQFDAVILDLPGPYNGLLNRFYTKEFFSSVQRVLKKDGLFSLGVTSSEEYIGPEMRDFNSSIYQTIKMVFPHVDIIPGERAFFIAGKSGTDGVKVSTLIDRLNSRSIKTTYVKPFYMRYKLTPERVRYVQERIETAKDVRRNFDLFPVSYYYDTVLWSTRLSPGFTAVFRDSERLLSFLSRSGYYWWVVPGLLFVIAIYALKRKKPRQTVPTGVILIATATAGLTGMALEILLIASFQSLVGYVYARVSLIVTVFMTGLVVGSWSMNRLSDKRRNRVQEMLMLTMLAAGLVTAGLPVLLGLLASLSDGLLVQLLFYLITVVTGLITGAVFPLAAKALYRNKDETGRVGGVVYGSDLLGAALGAIMISAFVFPITGLRSSCYTLCLLCMLSFSLLLIFQLASFPIQGSDR